MTSPALQQLRAATFQRLLCNNNIPAILIQRRRQQRHFSGCASVKSSTTALQQQYCSGCTSALAVVRFCSNISAVVPQRLRFSNSASVAAFHQSCFSGCASAPAFQQLHSFNCTSAIAPSSSFIDQCINNLRSCTSEAAIQRQHLTGYTQRRHFIVKVNAPAATL